MLHIERFVVNMIEENCYLLHDDTNEALFIDCGAYFPEEQAAIRKYVETHHLHVVRLVNTHSHFDHIFGDEFLFETYGVRPEMHGSEASNYQNASNQVRMFLHRDFSIATPEAGSYFKEGDTLTFGKHSIKVIHTPGHTPGGVCLYLPEESVLFSGDSLFYHAIGRTDFPGGSQQQLVNALKEKILTLPDDVNVYPGHGEATTIGEERLHNPFLF